MTRLYVSLIALVGLIAAPARSAGQQDISLTRATCSISGGGYNLACHWQNTSMSCTYNSSLSGVADSGTSCGSNSGFQTVVELTTSGSCTTSTTTACVTSLPMNAQCEPTTTQTTSVVITKTGACGGGGGTGETGCCAGQEICSGRMVCDPNNCGCTYGSPIVVDTTGNGFRLTSAEEGVMFDILGSGRPIKIAWTEADSGNAFLALDRNHNGKIDNGKELFGNHTAQSPSSDPNGYLALEEFDKPENGGNSDGIIDWRDAVFPNLLLWIDANHDGISQPEELHTLQELGVFSISLHYRELPYTDVYGNWFHYRAALNPDPSDGESKDGRWTYDVFFYPDDSARTCPKKTNIRLSQIDRLLR